jgi:L-fuculose-phosphate aldolase
MPQVAIFRQRFIMKTVVSLQALKKEICFVGHKLWQKGWVASNDGNISVRIGKDKFLTTPTGISKFLLKPEMILTVNSRSQVLQGNKKFKPTSEFPMHARCYQDRPDINSVVHAHPPYSTAFSVVNIPLDNYILPEAIVAFGAVPIAKFAMPSTQEVPDSIARWLPNHNVIILQNHGALTLSDTLMGAYFRMETLEMFAQTTFIANLLGKPKDLSQKQIQGCLDLRAKYGQKDRHPGYVKF